MDQASNYFQKQNSPQKEICLKLRDIIFKHHPDLKKKMGWGVPAYDGDKIYIVALKNHVNLGFSLKDLPKEKQLLLKGSGKTMKHLEFYTTDDIDETIIADLLNSVLSS